MRWDFVLKSLTSVHIHDSFTMTIPFGNSLHFWHLLIVEHSLRCIVYKPGERWNFEGDCWLHSSRRLTEFHDRRHAQPNHVRHTTNPHEVFARRRYQWNVCVPDEQYLVIRQLLAKVLFLKGCWNTFTQYLHRKNFSGDDFWFWGCFYEYHFCVGKAPCLISPLRSGPTHLMSSKVKRSRNQTCITAEMK